MTEGIYSTIESWTGARPISCPWQAFFDPFVQRVLRAYPWFKERQLATYLPWPTHREIAGIAHYDQAATAVASKRMKLEREESDRKRAAGVPNG